MKLCSCQARRSSYGIEQSGYRTFWKSYFFFDVPSTYRAVHNAMHLREHDNSQSKPHDTLEGQAEHGDGESFKLTPGPPSSAVRFRECFPQHGGSTTPVDSKSITVMTQTTRNANCSGPNSCILADIQKPASAIN